jgi:hypothetical protein
MKFIWIRYLANLDGDACAQYENLKQVASQQLPLAPKSGGNQDPVFQQRHEGDYMFEFEMQLLHFRMKYFAFHYVLLHKF